MRQSGADYKEDRDSRGEAWPLTVVCGGIGSGKSVVSRILRLRGEGVYDCDREASRLMTCDSGLKRAIVAEFGESAYLADGSLNRGYIAGIIFSDKSRRCVLDALVHAAVRKDLQQWREKSPRNRYVETAIPARAGMLGGHTDVLLVEAPEELRIERVMSRNGLGRADTEARIRSQEGETEAVIRSGAAVRVAVNDGRHPLLCEI